MTAGLSVAGDQRTPTLLGSYVVPGGVSDPRPVVEQARSAEALGLGTAWIGERYDTKDLPSLAGADQVWLYAPADLGWDVAAVSQSGTIGTYQGRTFVALINLNAEDNYRVTIHARKRE